MLSDNLVLFLDNLKARDSFYEISFFFHCRFRSLGEGPGHACWGFLLTQISYIRSFIVSYSLLVVGFFNTIQDLLAVYTENTLKSDNLQYLYSGC